MSENENTNISGKQKPQSPLDSLRARMKNGESHKKDNNDSGFGFVINNIEDENDQPKVQKSNDFFATRPEEKKNIPTFAMAEETESGSEITFEKRKEKTVKTVSLLKRMKRYTVDDNGVDAAEIKEPEYKLESVREILAHDSSVSKEDVAQAIGVTAETKEKPQETKDAKENKTEESENSTEVGGFISDIDSQPQEEQDKAEKIISKSDTATIRFTPVKGTNSISISSMTKPIEITGITAEGKDIDIVKEELAETEFEKFVPENEFNDLSSGRKLSVLLARKNRSRFLSFTASVLLTVILGFFAFSGSPNMIAVTVLFSLLFASNYSMFFAFKNAFNKNCSADIMAAFSAMFTEALCICSIIKEENCYYVALLASVVLALRSMCDYFEVSVLYGNLRRAISGKKKKALCNINEHSAVLAMAKNCIEGDVMIAASREVDTVNDFMKYSTYDKRLSGKTNIITYVAFAFSVVTGLVAGIMNDSYVMGLFTSSVIMLTASMPVLFFINTLPLKSAQSRLSKFGGVLTGFSAAEKLEQSNAAVISSEDIFPEGTVILHDMKVLSDNNVDELLVRAASLTKVLHSPLYPIFKKIARTNTEYTLPPSDTYKYEERLGLSGWVDNKTLFIGNRTLMEAHGIPVPGLEVDRQILSKGFFPVYVASGNKACVLIVIKYSADPFVEKKLKKVTELGVTLLIDNSDPNITSEMICDYFELYDDSILVMSGAGNKMCANLTVPEKSVSSPALYTGSSLGLAELITCASRLKQSNLVLTVLYAVAAVFCTVYFMYAMFMGGASIALGSTVLAFETIATLLTLIIFFIKKP